MPSVRPSQRRGTPPPRVDNVYLRGDAPAGVLIVVAKGMFSAALFEQLRALLGVALRADHGAVLFDFQGAPWGGLDAMDALRATHVHQMHLALGARQLVVLGNPEHRPFLLDYQASLAREGVSVLLAWRESAALQLVRFCAVYFARPPVVGSGRARLVSHV